jgi:signal peptidase I
MCRARRVAWGLALLALLAVLARAFFLGLYQVDSPSMEPTLHGSPEDGDWVLVAFGRGEGLRRHDLVVLVPEGETEPFVKRVVGLPGEAVALRAGDLWIDGAPLRSPGGLPVPIPVFDDSRDRLEVDWRLSELWSRAGEAWELDASGVAPGADAGLAFLRLPLADHQPAPGGGRLPGRVHVGDGRLEFEVEPLDRDFVLRAGLREQGDEFELALEPAGEGRARAVLTRESPLGREELAAAELPLAAGAHRIALWNVDDRLGLEVDGRRVLTHDYEGNHFHPRDEAHAGLSMPTDRAFLGGRGGRARFRGVRVLRDLHYTARGEHGVGEAVQLGPDEVFLLGDNSRESRDGRDWGPTPLSAVVGRPLAVLWPPSRARWLARPGSGDPAGSP